ncbi:hypothetical protein ABL78_1392 [Leptomonas seymouri]|uniref:Uncharacterized protein n=1 Tax=Leptomonas seymouri TaxID=5684 RepID=A0A0N0P844_LEPSE|nr:hypothetical protein ABL78_1392 [Leptomonas seymouri]|eukprot:KPI89516.1 hypothetical protein ABL78_1392 [Leptomonas seymouri]
MVSSKAVVAPKKKRGSAKSATKIKPTCIAHVKRRNKKRVAKASTENAASPPALEGSGENAHTTAWSASTITPFWVPQCSKKGKGANASTIPCDRFDIAGTTDVNELVLRHGTTPSSDLKASRRPVLFKRVSQRGAAHSPTQQKPAELLNSLFVLDRYLSNLVRALVHPLHNFLQCHHGLHNADEVQVMLMPKNGPIAAADCAVKSNAASLTPSKATSGTTLRRCYVATNNETLTVDSLQNAVQGWGMAGVFQISEFVLVRGSEGQHAEQKLLEYLRTRILSPAALHFSDKVLTSDQKALVVGERLPCAACRLFAIPYEDVSVLLPSHGHMYLSTIAPSLAALESNKATTEKGKKVVRSAYMNPAVAAKLLLSESHQRVLR